MAGVDRLLVIIAFLLILTGSGLHVGLAILSADYGFELEDPEIWSSRFPESALVHRLIHPETGPDKTCSVSPEAGPDVLPSPIIDYGALMPNDPRVMIALARFARRCGQGRHAIPLIRRALALGRSDIDILLESYRFRRFVGFRDPALAAAMDRKLVNFWHAQHQLRPDIARLIETCWSCRILFKEAEPEVFKEVEAYGKQ